MKHARVNIASGQIVELAEFNIAPELSPATGCAWFPVTTVEVGTGSQIAESAPVFNGTAVVVTKTRSDPPLADLKADKKAKVDALLAAKIAAGRVYGGNTYQIRPQDLSNITGIRVALLAGIANAHGGIWRSAANVDVAMDDAAFATFAANIMAYIRDLIRKGSAHKDAIDALLSAAAVDAYDITAGWPANT